MAWFILVLSAILEAVWANALSASNGFTELVPSLIFIAGIIPGMFMLAYAGKRIPMSTAYAVWAGLGAAFTVTYSIIIGAEPLTVARVLLLMGIVGSVIGLKVFKAKPKGQSADATGVPAHR
jgi:quaternary ammonium compound-resistance protein SugE